MIAGPVRSEDSRNLLAARTAFTCLSCGLSYSASLSDCSFSDRTLTPPAEDTV